MKLFWAVIAVLMAGGMYYWYSQRSREMDSAVGITPDPSRMTRVDTPSATPPKPNPASAVRSVAPEAEASKPVAEKPKPPAATQDHGSGVLAPDEAEEPQHRSTAPETKPAEKASGDSMSVAGADEGADHTEAKIETQSDGSILVDGKFKVTGEGTEESPYQVTWDHLLSVQDLYAPKDGKKKLPGRVTMLHNKWVEITGYIAFPIMSEVAEEGLSMMNQWDGCCIGVPPTPYDAVEVRLAEPVKGNARLTTFGVMKGRFKVDPHLVGGWLVGLYLMDEAEMTPQAFGGFAP